MRNAFSLTADPNTETVLTEPLAGEVGETPGALLIRLNMLYRRDGISRMYSDPNRVSRPLVRDVISEEGWTVIDSVTPARRNRTVSSTVSPPPSATLSSRCTAKAGARSTVTV